MELGAEDNGRGVESRLRALIDAPPAETPSALAETLRGAARTATELLRCEHATVTVTGPGGAPEHLEHVGPDELERPVAIDGAEVTRSAGALAVPIMLRGRPAGGLYLAAPRGRDAFDAADERAAVLVASAIATQVERSRTAAANRRRDRWTSGASALARELVSGADHRPLRLIAHRVLDIADADLVAVLRPHAEGTGERFIAAAAAGPDSTAWKHVVLGRDALGLGPVGDDRAVHVEDLSERIAGSDPVLGGRLGVTPVGSALVVALTGPAGGRGVLVVGRRPGRTPFTAAETGMATMFAGQVALALDLAESLADRNQAALIEERDRIARDLHDHVIQRLFAVGLAMQYIGTDPQADPAASMERVRAGVEEIDDTIKQIRATIYRLRGPIMSPDASLRRQVTRLLDDLESVLGFRPDLTVDGPVDFGVDDDLVDDCVAVLREALTNVARHAGATRVAVSIAVSSSDVALEVTDDGRGMGESTRRSGLHNLRTRAEQRHGHLAVEPVVSGGTRLRWTVPAGGSHPVG